MATIEDRDRLFLDDLDDVNFTLEAGANFRHSTEAILANKSVQHVTITVHRTFSRRCTNEKEDILALFRAVGRLPKLRSLNILSIHGYVALELPSCFLAETVNNARTKLERFQLNGVVLRLGSIQDQLDLAAAFQNHPSLSEVGFNRLIFRDASGEEISSLESPFPEFWAALSSLPELEHLGIRYRRTSNANNNARNQMSIKKAKLHCTVIADFCKAPKLTQLELFNCELYDEHLEALASSFASFHNLQELSLSCQSFGLKACEAIAQILATNSVLQQLYLEPKKSCSNLDAKCTGMIADALANNPDSKLGGFVLEGLMVASLEPFVKMMRVHYRLQELAITAVQSNVWLETELKSLLKLNEIGRYELFQHQTPGSSRCRWVKALIDAQGDLHCLFYLLSSNPLLCQLEESR